MRVKVWLVTSFLFVGDASAQVSVLTANYGNSRTNANLSERVLTTENVSRTKFGRVFALPVDGQVYAQPLYMSQLAAGGATHNALFVATMSNSVFAFDADGWAGQPLWEAHFGSPVPYQEYGFADIQPTVGILGTPVIDEVTGTLYVVSDHFENGSFLYRLHALNVTTGAERAGSPAEITGSVAGTSSDSVNGVLAFDPAQHLQRPGLLLLNGVVYIAFGSHADIPPYHGWIMGFDASDVSRQISIWCTSPDGNESAIWQSGRGLAADAVGNIYVSTGNGDFDGVRNFGESFVKLTPGSAGLTVADWFTPDTWVQWNGMDQDLGSSGLALIPGTDLMVGGGKAGTAFVTHTGKLGHTVAGNGQVAQQFAPASNGMYGMAVWEGPTGPVLFVQNGDSVADGYGFSGSQFSLASQSSGATTGTQLANIAVSSNGTTAGTGIVWATAQDQNGPGHPGRLVALNATNLAAELWDSTMNQTDVAGLFAKFATPTVANGRVYLPTFSNQVVVYGLTDPKSGTPQITTVTNAGSFAGAPLAPGEMVTVFGVGLGPQTPVGGLLQDDGTLASVMAGTSILIDGTAAPLLESSAGQVSAIVPFGVTGSTVTVTAEYNGKRSREFTLPLAPAAPGLIALDASGSGQGAFLNQDGSVNGAAHPATRGQVLVLYGCGLGQLSTPAVDGKVEAGATPLALSGLAVLIGGQPATVLYAGAAPGEVAGVYQINATIPESITPGDSVPVAVQVGAASSQLTVTAAIR